MTLFSEDFQSGGYAAWSMSGNGQDVANNYNGSWSMRLDGLRQGQIALSSQGYVNVSLSMEMAALYLVKGDLCYAEYSTNGGSTWKTVVSVNYLAADGSMRSGSIASGLDNNSNLRVRFRAYTLYGHYCYGDNVLLTGVSSSPPPVPAIGLSGSGAFGNVDVGQQVSNTLTIRNDGAASLVLGSISGASAPFSLANDGCSSQNLAPGANCTVVVKFAPVAGGGFSSTLSIPSNDPATPSLAVALNGTGVAASTVYDPFSGSGNVSRTQLGYSVLTGSSSIALIDYSHYAVPAGAANPANTFQGRLKLTGQANGNIAKVGGSQNLSDFTRAKELPDFEFDFVQHGTHFIPVRRGRIEGTHPSWTLVLEPGRVWNENGDNGYSRVAFPFTLQQQWGDCMWNGVMTFLFKDDGSTSNLAYQIAGETCYLFKANFWGKLAATYTPGSVSNASAITAEYVDEVARRMPVKPIAALATDYPASGINVAKIGSQIPVADMTIFGVAFNGVHYVGGCGSRYGTHPFCEVLDVPSYSTAKSVLGAYGLMRLEQKYSGTQATELIGNWVPECTGAQWKTTSPKPTFENAMDMATGNYTSATSYSTDEDSTAYANGFLLPAAYATKVAYACGLTRKATPGSKFIYHTSDTFLLGRAINMYYKNKAGNQNVDWFDDVMVGEVFVPLGLSPTLWTTLRTKDATAQPYTGQGLIYVRDDIVKLANFMNLGQGKINGNQVLDAGMVAATLNLGTGGLPLTSSSQNDRYNNGFWYYNLGAESGYGCGSQKKWVPYMSGYGGNSVVLLPNGMIYYNFSDSGIQTWSTSAMELNKIASMCP